MTGCALLLVVLLAMACAPAQTVIPLIPLPPERASEVFAGIDLQNRTVKKSAAWLREAYRAIAIRRLSDIPPAEYARYRRYVKDASVYVIVHPGYFPFFDEWNLTPIATDYTAGFPQRNVAERLSDAIDSLAIAYQIAREQERITRDFIEFMSAEKRLTVLLLPRDYRDHLTYGYVAGYDEFARYINELTNQADNIVYLESDGDQNGYLRDDDLAMLGAFLDAAGVRTLMLGGGFLGKCLDNLSGSLRKRYRHEDIWYVAEITAFSPYDVVADRGRLLTFWGHLRFENVRDYYTSIPVNRTTSERLRWASIPLYAIDRVR